jgi:hypothetical protein
LLEHGDNAALILDAIGVPRPIVSESVVECLGGRCHGRWVRISGELGARFRLRADDGGYDWYTLVSDAKGIRVLLHDDDTDSSITRLK